MILLRILADQYNDDRYKRPAMENALLFFMYLCTDSDDVWLSAVTLYAQHTIFAHN